MRASKVGAGLLDERRFTPPNIEARPSASGARRRSYTRGSEAEFKTITITITCFVWQVSESSWLCGRRAALRSAPAYRVGAVRGVRLTYCRRELRLVLVAAMHPQRMREPPCALLVVAAASC